jgi:peptidoglycan/xylan/chitin deacetylase (PgdA/CDA1 family)
VRHFEDTPTQVLANISRLRRSLARVARTRYPAFLFGAPLARGEIPTFTYHDVDADSLTADLTFLRENGYRTVGIDEFMRCARDGKAERRVLLTFDDARRNFWEVAFPLLRAFGVRATLFVPTYWIGGSVHDAGQAQERDQSFFMTWDQLRSCLRSGCVDIQSHAHRHTLVYASRQLVGFACPQALATYDVYDWPMRQEGDAEQLGYPPLGTPIYHAVPLLSAAYREIEEEAVVRACRGSVESEGGAGFFERRGWMARLCAVHDQVAGRRPPPRRVSDAEFQDLVASEFQQARQCFGRELGVLPRYLAYPWMLGSRLSLDLAKESGIMAVFGVGLDFRRARRLAGPVPAFGRLKGDWLRFLPGRGRLQLRDILPGKLKGFLRSQHLAH